MYDSISSTRCRPLIGQVESPLFKYHSVSPLLPVYLSLVIPSGNTGCAMIPQQNTGFLASYNGPGVNFIGEMLKY